MRRNYIIFASDKHIRVYIYSINHRIKHLVPLFPNIFKEIYLHFYSHNYYSVVFCSTSHLKCFSMFTATYYWIIFDGGQPGATLLRCYLKCFVRNNYNNALLNTIYIHFLLVIATSYHLSSWIESKVRPWQRCLLLRPCDLIIGKSIHQSTPTSHHFTYIHLLIHPL